MQASPLKRIIAVSPIARKGVPLASYWNNKFTPEFDALYYWYDNSASGPTAMQLKLVQKHKGTNFATQFRFDYNDAYYELLEIVYGKIQNRVNGTYTAPLDSTHIATNIDTFKYASLAFNGTGLKIMSNALPASGIVRVILFDGVFRGFTKTHAYGQSSVVADKAEGRYYIILEAGNYSSIDASLSSLQLYDLIYYHNSAWEVIHEADYTYTDFDAYDAVGVVKTFDIFSGLPQANYKVGVVAKNTKNPSSSGYTCFLKNGTILAEKTFIVDGGITNNYFYTIKSISSSATHIDMSTSIKKNGTAQTSQWIPTHGSNHTLIHRTGEDKHIFFDDVEKTGYLTGETPLTAITKFNLTNVVYAVNPAAPTEELIEITHLCEINLIACQIDLNYKVLVAVEAGTGYSYMVPWDTASMNKFITDTRSEYSLPAALATVNVSNGGALKNVLTYNDTPSGDYENLLLRFEITDPVTTNRNSVLQSFLFGIAGTYGKFYCYVINNEVLPIDYEWSTSIKIRCGKVTDLIFNVGKYVV